MMQKARIAAIGIISDGIPVAWGFDSQGRDIAAIEIKDDAILYGGYSVNELQLILDRKPHRRYCTRCKKTTFHLHEEYHGVLMDFQVECLECGKIKPLMRIAI